MRWLTLLLLLVRWTPSAAIQSNLATVTSTAVHVSDGGKNLKATPSNVVPKSPLSKDSCRVVVVGGGPAGLATALALEKLGYNNIIVIEKLPSGSFDDSRAYNFLLDPRGLEIIKEIGVLAQVDEKGFPYTGK